MECDKFVEKISPIPKAEYEIAKFCVWSLRNCIRCYKGCDLKFCTLGSVPDEVGHDSMVGVDSGTTDLQVAWFEEVKWQKGWQLCVS